MAAVKIDEGKECQVQSHCLVLNTHLLLLVLTKIVLIVVHLWLFAIICLS